MSRTIKHVLLSKTFPFGRCPPVPAREVRFNLNRPGKLEVLVSAPAQWELDDDVPPGVKPKVTRPHNFRWALFDADGKPFVGKTIETSDLDRFRDNRGSIQGEWTLRIPELRDLPVEEFLGFVGDQTVTVAVTEKVEYLSAPPLIDRSGILSNPRDHREQTFEVDLYRLGTLKIRVKVPTAGDPDPAVALNTVEVSLVDPNGRKMVTSESGRLDCEITPVELALSRGPGGTKRPWWVRVKRLPAVVPPTEGYRLIAQVVDTLAISRKVLQNRLDAVFGTDGTNLTVRANWDPAAKTNRFTLRINNSDVAETFEMHGLEDHLDGDLNPSLSGIEAKREYVLTTKTIDGSKTIIPDWVPFLGGASAKWSVEMKNLKTRAIQLNVGRSRERRDTKMVWNGSAYTAVPSEVVLIPEGLPAFFLEATTSGSIYVRIDGDDAEMVVPKLRIELALAAADDGRLSLLGWIDPDSLKYSGEGSALFVNVYARAMTALREGLADFLRSDFFHRVFEFFMGGRFQFTSTRCNDDRMQFDYIAAVEPERRPNPGYVPLPLTGPTSQPSPNLSKIDHIVVLMMENRSFDHVLGHLSLEDINKEVNGLTQDVIRQFSAPGQEFRPYSQAGFTPKTRFPLSVGHEYDDVQQQLAGGMKGFVDNFRQKHPDVEELADAKCVPNDVLGYHPRGLLPMYDFLAEEFAVADRFYCSHPGPTMPNRMFSLSGGLQYDRYGEPRLRNDMDSLILSRDVTIFDLLTQRGISWRIYESPPSVSMLRFFSKYAGDATNIVDIRSLEGDSRKGWLPSVTFIDPQFHYHPSNDDHPPQDMMRGQHLVRRVYKALRSNPAIWNKTLFVVTYDEHGGFFDHVVPEAAEIYRDPRRGNQMAADTPASAQAYRPDVKVNYGVRVPTFLISPWVAGGKALKNRWDFTSILKTILNRFCGENQPFLSDRVSHAADLGAALSLAQPRSVNNNPPDLPQPLQVVMNSTTKRTIRKAHLTRPGADWHDLMAVIARMVSATDPSAMKTRAG